MSNDFLGRSSLGRSVSFSLICRDKLKAAVIIRVDPHPRFRAFYVARIGPHHHYLVSARCPFHQVVVFILRIIDIVA